MLSHSCCSRISDVFSWMEKTSTSSFSLHCATSYHRSYFGDDIKNMINTFESSPYQVFPIFSLLMFPVSIELDSFGLPVFRIRASPPLKLTMTAFYSSCFFFVWPLITHNCGFFPELFVLFSSLIFVASVCAF